MALSLNVNVPVAEPTAVGEKVTPTVQLFPARTPVPQVLLVTANGPLAAMLGCHIPLDTERGYHVMLEHSGVHLRRPILSSCSST